MFSGSLVVPLAALGLPYVVSGAVGDFVEGVFVSPQARRDVAYWPTPPVPSIALAVLLAALLYAMTRVSRAVRWTIGLALVVMAIAGLVLAGFVREAYLTYWITGRGMGVVIVLLGTYLLVRDRHATSTGRRDVVFLLLALAALTSLVQFPFGIAVYYCYAAPLVALAAVGVLSQRRVRAAWVPAVLIAAFAVYGALYMDRAMFGKLAGRYVRDAQIEILDPSGHRYGLTRPRPMRQGGSCACSGVTAGASTPSPAPTARSSTSWPICAIRRGRCSTSSTRPTRLVDQRSSRASTTGMSLR